MSLPTPPGTSHRGKENKLPGSRVAWAQQNQYFVLSNTPKGVVPLPWVKAHQEVLPTKSILKKCSQSFLAIPEEDQREITPEPEDPLVNLTYLSRPVETIIALDATLRDLIEAYSILNARIRAVVTSSTDADASCSLFQPLRKNSQAFTDAVIRDLGRALVEPKLNAAQEDDDLPLPCNEEREEEKPLSLLPSPKQSPKKKKQGMSATQVKFARDLCTTTHAVLRVLGPIFTLPALYQIFSDVQLRDMLTQVLAIPMAVELPTPNARKTCALSIWLLQVQRLPEDVLLPARDRIAFALRRGLEGELGKEGKKGSACDGLKAIHDLSLFQPRTFIPAFTELLPSILTNLLAPTLALRTQACHALGGFVLGCVNIPSSYLHTRISNAVSTFLTAPPTTSPRKSPPTTNSDPIIIRTLRTTLNTADPHHVAQGPVWALSVLASFIVLLGPKFCTDVRLTRVVSALLALAMRNKKSSVRALACLVWRCAAWAYLRPPLESDPDDETDEIEDLADTDVKLARENSWKLVRSIVDMGAGISTIAALLGDESEDEDRLWKAISLVQAMIKKGGQTCADGMEIARLFVSSDSESTEEAWTLNKLLPSSLFSSDPGLLSSDYKTLSTVVKPIFDDCPQLTDIRPLTRDELSRDWVFDEMIDVWRSGLGRLEILDDHSTPVEVIGIWKGLLKANVAVLSDIDDHEGIVDFAAKAASILVEILRDPKLDLTPSSSSMMTSPIAGLRDSKTNRNRSARSNSSLKLSVIRELWATMRVVFPYNLLHAAGTMIVRCLVEDESDLVWETDVPDDARMEWAQLCAETLAVCDGDELRKFWEKRPHSIGLSYEVGVESLVWGCFVKKWKKDTTCSWEGAVILLGVPFGTTSIWQLNNNEFSTWDDLLRHTMNKANDNGVDTIALLDLVAEALSRTACPSLVSFIRVADLLLSQCELPDARQLPSEVFDFVNDTLRSTYPPEPRNLKPSVWLIRTLTRAVDACPVELRFNLLEAIHDGVSPWLSDEYSVFSQEDYALDVLPLYQNVLLGIQELPQNLRTLEVFSPLLHSVFCGRDDKPSDIREAFMEFWTATFVDYDEPENGWPEEIQICLRSCTRPIKNVAVAELSGGHAEEAEDSTVYISSSEDSASEKLQSRSSSPVCCSDTASLWSERTIQDILPDQANMSPFIGRLGPALFPSVDLQSERVFSRASSPIESSPGPSTPIKRPKNITTPPRPHKQVTIPESFQSLLLRSPAPKLPIPHTPSTPRRSPVVKVASSVSPSKRRKLDDKENVSPRPLLSVVERICASSPRASEPTSVLGKRHKVDDSPYEGISKKGRTASTTFIRSAIPFPSSEGSDVEDELSVEASLFSPTAKRRSDSCTPSESSQATITSRKRKRQRVILDAVVVPSLADIRQQGSMRRRVSADEVELQSATRSLRRSLSKLNTFEADGIRERRKRLKHWDDTELSSVTNSPSLSALEETVIAGSDDSIMLTGSVEPSSHSQGSDDDPHPAQLSPCHLFSPAPRRYLDQDHPSDAFSSSPSRDLLARRQQRFGATVRQPTS